MVGELSHDRPAAVSLPRGHPESWVSQGPGRHAQRAERLMCGLRGAVDDCIGQARTARCDLRECLSAKTRPVMASTQEKPEDRRGCSLPERYCGGAVGWSDD